MLKPLCWYLEVEPLIRREGGALTNGISARMRMHAQSLQLFLILCDSMSCSPPGSSFHGISQAKTLELLAMPSSRGSS